MSDKKRDFTLFVEDIISAVEKIERYTKKQSFKDFSENEMAVDAAIRNFEVIGEAAAKIPKEVKDTYPFVEWKEMTGFRNILIHDYFGVDVESLWDTIRKNIPQLKKNIKKLKKEIGK
jgi:uncharacterized protein with HEPN domain